MEEVKLYCRHSAKGDKLYVEYYSRGVRKRESLNLSYTKANVAYATKNIVPEIERKIRYGIDNRKYKISEFLSDVLEVAREERKKNTFETYLYGVNKFKKFIGDINVEDITIKDIEKYIKTLKESGMSSATIVVYLSPIHQAFDDAIRLGVITQNPVAFARKPQVKNKEFKVFNVIQAKTLLDKAEGELKTFLHIALFTGARAGEILALRWKDIAESKISIEKTKVKNHENSPKNGKPRKVPIMKPLGDYLSQVQRGGKDEFVVKCSYVVAKRNFYALLESLGYEKRVLHTLRHTFASLLYMARENPSMIRDFLGHSSMDMLNRKYAHHIEDEFDLKRTEELFG